MKKAIILLSGGLDSATVCAIAKSQGYELYGLSFFYGQRHEIEINCAKKIAKFFNFKEHKIAQIDLKIFGNSALTDDIAVPKSNQPFIASNSIDSKSTPITYVPARNTIFLSYALAYGEVIKAFDIFIGINSIDYSGYVDCRKEFVDAFTNLANLATDATVKNNARFEIHAPLADMDKKTIITTGLNLKVDYSLTHSCYDPEIIGTNIYSCGQCDSCRIRLNGFKMANQEDKILYKNL